MPKTRKKSFESAHNLLEEIRAQYQTFQNSELITSHQLRPLRTLQTLLIKEITRAERKIKRSKAILKTHESTEQEELVSALKERIEFYRHLVYVWRCFGDAIAFLFLDKYALKQTYYNTHNANAKQDAGFISGKKGLHNEMKVLNSIIDQGIPAVLSDLTNTIRHGDVCVLTGPDPILIEVKSGKLDSRGKKQRNSIRQLHNFFESDEASELRGYKKLHRVSYQIEEVTYVDALTDCLKTAEKNSFAWRSPEEGLYYIALTNEQISFEDIASELNLTQPTFFMLNEAKINRDWSPYTPFTLTIKNKESLFSFIWGEIAIFVLYDFEALKLLAKKKGLLLSILPSDSDFAFEISNPSGELISQTSQQMFARHALEFTSPAWILETAIQEINVEDETQV